MPKHHKEIIITSYKLILEIFKSYMKEFSPHIKERQKVDKVIEFYENIISPPDSDKARIIFIISALYKDLERDNITTTEELRGIIVRNRVPILSELQQNWTSKRTEVFKYLKKMIDKGILVRDTKRSKPALPKKLSKGAYYLSDSKIEQYCGVTLSTIIDQITMAKKLGALDLNPKIFSEKVVSKFSKKKKN